MIQFASREEAGARLAAIMRAELSTVVPWVLCPLGPGGADVLDGMDTDGAIIVPLEVRRGPDGVQVPMPACERIRGACAVLIDDGVETGTAARAAAAVLRQCGPQQLVLAVPVCPQEAAADLQGRFDQIIAVTRPLARRDLRWHYKQ